MSPLSHLLVSGAASDLIIISQGEFFLVHRQIIKDRAPKLYAEAIKSKFLGGEAYTLPEVAPNAFRKILCYLYRDDLSEVPGLSNYQQQENLSPAVTEFGKRFPNTDQFLSTVLEAPLPSEQGGPSRPAVEEFDNKKKWEHLTSKQRLMKDPYVEDPCTTLAEVTTDADVFNVSEKLEIPGLQNTAMNRVTDWFANEVQLGSPLSEDLRLGTGYILRKNRAFTGPILKLCAQAFTAIEKDSYLPSLIATVCPDEWSLLVAVKTQHEKENAHIAEALRRSQRQVQDLDIKLKDHSENLEKSETDHKTHLEALHESLRSAQNEAASARARIEFLESLSGNLRKQLLANQAAELQQKENLPSQPSTEKALLLRKDQANLDEAKRLKTELTRKDEALRTANESLKMAKSAHRKVKDELRKENEELASQFDDIIWGLKKLRNEVDKNEACRGCKRRWNFTLEYQKSPAAVGVTCKLCRREAWYAASG